MTEETVRNVLIQCIQRTREEAQKHVSEPLPEPLFLGLDAFGQHGKDLSLDEVMTFLYRKGTCPAVVDVAVRGIRGGRTFIWIPPSGHGYVSDFSQTWNTPEGMGPFKSLGLSHLLQQIPKEGIRKAIHSPPLTHVSADAGRCVNPLRLIQD